MAKKQIKKKKVISKIKSRKGIGGRKTPFTKKKFKTALEMSRGNRTKAAIRLGVVVTTVSNYIKKWPEMAMVEENSKGSYIIKCEDKLAAAVDAGNLTAVIFSLKTQDPENYSERHEIGGLGGQPVEVRILKEEADL